MPTASDELRKLWHTKPVWVKLDGDNAPIRFNEQSGTWCFFGWTRLDSGDLAAERYLLKRGYIEHRFMWYRPKASIVLEQWTPTEKEASALAYLCDEWDHSYDLREYPVILAAERATLIEYVLSQGEPRRMRPEMDKALTKYAGLSRALA